MAHSYVFLAYRQDNSIGLDLGILLSVVLFARRRQKPRIVPISPPKAKTRQFLSLPSVTFGIRPGSRRIVGQAGRADDSAMREFNERRKLLHRVAECKAKCYAVTQLATLPENGKIANILQHKPLRFSTVVAYVVLFFWSMVQFRT